MWCLICLVEPILRNTSNNTTNLDHKPAISHNHPEKKTHTHTHTKKKKTKLCVILGAAKIQVTINKNPCVLVATWFGVKVPDFLSWVNSQDPKINMDIRIHKYIYIYIPGTQMTSIFEGQPPKTRPFPIKTRVIWVPGTYIGSFSPSKKSQKTWNHILFHLLWDPWTCGPCYASSSPSLSDLGRPRRFFMFAY